MLHGVLLREFVRPARRSTDEVLRALDTWAARARMPDTTAVWAVRDKRHAGDRITWQLERALLDGLRARGVEPIVFLETSGTTYVRILAREHDAELGRLAYIAGGCIVRIDQEPNGTGLRARWQVSVSPAENALYVPHFQHTGRILIDEGGCQPFYCPVGTIDDMLDYDPGREVAPVVGYTIFRRSSEAPMPPQQWRAETELWQQAAPGARIVVGETGTAADTRRRPEWLRQHATAGAQLGLYAALPFDMLIGNGDDWRWNGGMYDVMRTELAPAA